MPSSYGLKICSFNAKCDKEAYNNCLKSVCGNNTSTELSSSLLAILIAINILPSKADIYNIQNIQNVEVVENLLKEIYRVKNIMSSIDLCSTNTNAYFQNVACRLNDGVNDNDLSTKNLLDSSRLCGINYVDMYENKNYNCSQSSTTLPQSSLNLDFELLKGKIMKYQGIEEYNAYYNGTCLTLIKKSLSVIPETKEIPSVDSLVLLFEYNARKFINVNINLGCVSELIEDIGCKREQVDNIIAFIKKYENCGSVIMTGAFGDFDYDVSQLIFRGDSKIPEQAQRSLSNKQSSYVVPADFPCDATDSVYQIMDILLKQGHGEMVPYSWLLQYLRLKCSNKCVSYKTVETVVNNKFDDCKKCPIQSVSNRGLINRSELRNLVRTSDKHKSHNKKQSCNKPACEPKNTNCCNTNCQTICTPTNCVVPVKKCKCDKSLCAVKANKNKCDCDNSRHRVTVNLCAEESESDSDEEDVCASDKCDVNFCDTITLLKNELSLYNSLDRISDVNDRYTEFFNHYNRSLDCKFPKGIFQALLQCQEYKLPCMKSRDISNNAELLAFDHFLVSDCIKSNIVSASLSDLCIEKYGIPAKTYILEGKENILESSVYDPQQNISIGGFMNSPVSTMNDDYVFQYGGSTVKSFFTHRLYCVNFEFHNVSKNMAAVSCDESLHGLGLTSLWNTLLSYASSTNDYNSDSVGILTLQLYGLDKHEYFLNLFWDCVEPMTCGSSSEQTVPLMYIQKKDRISENEFYKHLLCVLSNSKSRDLFVISITFMDAIYRYDSLRSIISSTSLPLIEEPEFKELLVFIKKDLLSSEHNISNVIPDDIIKNLGYVLKNNLTLIDILSSYVVKVIASKNITNGEDLINFVENYTDSDPKYDAAMSLISNECRFSISDSVNKLSHVDTNIVIIFLIRIMLSV